MSARKQQLRKLARIALLLLIGATVGLLAGQVDDDDDNFGLASLEPGIVHRLTRKSHQNETPAPVHTAFARVQAVVRSVSLSADITSLPATPATSLAIPLRT